ncbi:MAG: nitroreductase family protein [Anaerolineae bacterium]|nr:nitroreductase family protein [Thermoflexales bacterium]MDW8406209.1 nitroreductase family protein [Anaerolineae bacterium]
MDFFDVVQSRRSIRSFLDKPVEADKLHQLLEAVNRAPSAGNLQAYEIFVACDAQRRAALAHASLGQSYVASAPVALVFCAHPQRSATRYGERGARLYAVQDATIACTYAMLAATALGMASVWIGAFSDQQVWQAIGSPEGLEPVAILSVGYAAEQREPSRRRPLNTIVHYLD